jgi:hypothetical protein
MTLPGGSDSREVWITPEGGVASTKPFQDRLKAGDPAAHRELAALSAPPPANSAPTRLPCGPLDSECDGWHAMYGGW